MIRLAIFKGDADERQLQRVIVSICIFIEVMIIDYNKAEYDCGKLKKG